MKGKYMKFKNKEEKMEWLKGTATKIKEMNEARDKAIMAKEFEKAYSLLKGIMMAKKMFGQVSRTLR